MNNLKRLSLLAALVTVGSAANAVVVFYGGDFDQRNGLANERDTAVADSWVFDDFTLSSAMVVTAVFSNDLSSLTGVTTADYEIRQGASIGNGGTLLFSGTGVAATATPTGRTGFGFTEIMYRVGGLNLAMVAGTYHLSVRPVGTTGRSFVSTTQGANSVGAPIGNGNGLWNSTSFGQNFSDPSNSLGAGTWDFSIGVEGAVPEPMTMLALAGGLFALIARRRK